MRRSKLNFLLGEFLFLIFFLIAFLSLIGLSPRGFVLYDLDETQLIPTIAAEYPDAMECTRWDINGNQLVLFQYEGKQYYQFFERFPLNGKYRFEPFRSAPFQTPTVRDFWSSYRLDLTGDKPVILSQEPFSGIMPHPASLVLLAACFLALFSLWAYLRWQRYFPRPIQDA